MSTVERTVPFGRVLVYDALADPTTYPHWLLGAREIRSVDADFPRPGTSFHHRVGLVGPLKISDSSTAIAAKAPSLLVLEVRARPLVHARVTFRLRAAVERHGTVIEMEEEPLGPFRAAAPVLDPLTDLRNRRSLASLEDLLATGRSHRAPG
jgi:uncharacterized protein YndB with AHSA1/START domain